MEFHLRQIIGFLSLLLVAAHAALSPELYWNSVLPNTPMPKAVSDLLSSSDLMEDKRTSVDVGKGGVDVTTGKGSRGRTSVGIGKGGVGVNTSKGTNVGVGKGGVTVGTRTRNGKPVYVGVTPSANPFDYEYAATENQLHSDPNAALFFLEKDMISGKKMSMYFPDTQNTATFLPRHVSNSIPFSSKKLPEIFKKFSVKPDSVEAEIMKETIHQCEEPGIKGEEKYCATSLEPMIDFATSKLGKNVQAVSTEVEKPTDLQRFTIMKGVQKMGGEKSVVCHKQNYAYAVFYCHTTRTSRAYIVPLEGHKGTKVKAVAICHTDTSAWNPKHLAFQVLKVAPGTVPVCHFLPQDHVVWSQK